MNEFEWLNQTRALAQPSRPARDLWPGIATRLNASKREAARPRHLLPWAMAASLAVTSLVAGALAWQQSPAPAMPALAHITPTTMPTWKPDDPQLAGAAIELNIARRQLRRAIAEQPQATYLHDMLKHANEQVHRLQQLSLQAG